MSKGKKTKQTLIKYNIFFFMIFFQFFGVGNFACNVLYYRFAIPTFGLGFFKNHKQAFVYFLKPLLKFLEKLFTDLEPTESATAFTNKASLYSNNRLASQNRILISIPNRNPYLFLNRC